MSTEEAIARPRRTGEVRKEQTTSISMDRSTNTGRCIEDVTRSKALRRRVHNDAISNESPAIPGVIDIVITRPIFIARKPSWDRSFGIRSAPVLILHIIYFFFQAEDGIRDWSVTGVQTCALPI